MKWAKAAPRQNTTSLFGRIQQDSAKCHFVLICGIVVVRRSCPTPDACEPRMEKLKRLNLSSLVSSSELAMLIVNM